MKMFAWLKKPQFVLGISVGIGVIYAVRVLRREQRQEQIIRPSSESNRITRAVKIPKGFVGHVLGKGGSTIKKIREKTGARITFDDSDNDFTVASVSGSPNQVDQALELVQEIISTRKECITKEIMLKFELTDFIFKNINCIRQICDMTRAKITFDFLPSRNGDNALKVIIKGRQEEVEPAIEMIDELLAGGEANISSNSKQIHVAGRALPENLPIHSNSFDSRQLPCEKLIPSSSDGYLEVYISSINSPSKFWVQISGSKSIQLDKLATEMTEFYNDEKNRERCHLNTINVGDIVAAFFQGDNSWYRAQVTDVAEEITVFYLDFGDTAILKPDLISLLKPEYLSIAFQAIECTLPDIAPIHEQWTPEAIEDFGKMVHLGEWKIIMSKPLNHSDKSPRPVQLMDTNTPRNINVSEELVVKAHAQFVQFEADE